VTNSQKYHQVQSVTAVKGNNRR